MDINEFIPVSADLTELPLQEMFSELLQWLQLLTKSYTDPELEHRAKTDPELAILLKRITSSIQLAVNIVNKTSAATKQYSLLSQKIMDHDLRFKRIQADSGVSMYGTTWTQLATLHGLREMYRHYMKVNSDRMTSTCTMINMLNDDFMANYEQWKNSQIMCDNKVIMILLCMFCTM